jgi:hypothetical protein
MFPFRHDLAICCSILPEGFNPLFEPRALGFDRRAQRGSGGLQGLGLLREFAVLSRQPKRETPGVDRSDHERRKP